MAKQIWASFLIGASFAGMVVLGATWVKIWFGVGVCAIIVVSALVYTFIECVIPENNARTNRM